MVGRIKMNMPARLFLLSEIIKYEGNCSLVVGLCKNCPLNLPDYCAEHGGNLPDIKTMAEKMQTEIEEQRRKLEWLENL